MSNSNVLHHVDEQALSDLIRRHESFTLTKVKNFNQTVKKVEHLIEKQGLSCRVYTAGRSATMAAALASGPAVIFGLASAAAIAAHKVATLNPDYEIAKYPLADKLVVNFKK
ncbi:hypothetical protein BST50_17340 [Vibrio vulnificus]|uniref:hypothetical protein n=1 Tax=Vibrio vulnificus TaxID=672 RepID=UPI0009B62B0A|nr:hypothetical protein [Vibrio vulnificus]EGR0230472.1 hypothetical protein [Vibrio vulnificus]MCU8487155.1 hypothetical protein [Vibrio vulnificus]OQK39592.1 hypothetical protein XM72_c12021 [Vibrio vulnificus]PAO30861.1 hypothetical protein BST49_17500 [Vibrio vulnificus]PAO39608.1 hypothetical protein BST50_17340 [Vibrio vulnificus]